MNNPNNIISSIMQLLQLGQSPEVLIQGMVKQNPQLQILFNQQQQSGMDWKSFAVQLARQQNVDITPILQGFQQKGIRL